MLKSRLTILGHPNPDTFDVDDEAEYRSAVLWLEDQKIRHYKIEEREGLRGVEDDGVWGAAFARYQEELGSPVVSEGTPLERLAWLTSLAVRLEYGDDAARFNAAVKERTSAPDPVRRNPLDGLDLSGAAFATGVARAATLASIGPHPDPRVRLGALAALLKSAPHPRPQGPNRETVESPADVLDLLFLNELRALQTNINEALVSVQKITANPKTDTALGKVGF